jgi:hypothetical protein
MGPGKEILPFENNWKCHIILDRLLLCQALERFGIVCISKMCPHILATNGADVLLFFTR